MTCARASPATDTHTGICAGPSTSNTSLRRIGRLAHALGADAASTDPARVLRAVGALSFKTDPPAPVICERIDGYGYVASDIVGGLPDPPERRAPARQSEGLWSTRTTMFSRRSRRPSTSAY